VVDIRHVRLWRPETERPMIDRLHLVVYALQGPVGDPELRPGQDAVAVRADGLRQFLEGGQARVGRPNKFLSLTQARARAKRENAGASDFPFLVDQLARRIENPTQGSPFEVFLLVSRLTPMVNVDLLIKDAQGRNLLTWRDDEHYGAGWHLPGGIVRFKERLETRVRAVALSELGAMVSFEPTPLALNEIIRPDHEIRGHFISFLFRCSLMTPLPESRRYHSGRPMADQWEWHIGCHKDLLVVHDVYKRFL
jgi:colanic acid biosynthesis protein WcaH